MIWVNKRNDFEIEIKLNCLKLSQQDENKNIIIWIRDVLLK